MLSGPAKQTSQIRSTDHLGSDGSEPQEPALSGVAPVGGSRSGREAPGWLGCRCAERARGAG